MRRAHLELRWLREHAVPTSELLLPAPSLLGVYESEDFGLGALLSYEGNAKMAVNPVFVTTEDE